MSRLKDALAFLASVALLVAIIGLIMGAVVLGYGSAGHG